MIVAWTGHRPDLFRDPNLAQRSVQGAADDLVEQGALEFLVGGQRGVDTWAALAAIERDVPFTLILPLALAALDEFTRDWPAADRVVLSRTLSRAREVRCTESYSERNRQLASGADVLMAVWTRIGGGGTTETIAFAREAGTPIREIVLESAPDAQAARGRGV
jgi:hypothetical protein